MTRISDFICNNKAFRLKEKVTTWEQAVRVCCDVLEEVGCVSESYYQGIIDCVEEFGPYFVIAPGIAIPHARPEFGAEKIGFSLVTLETPVNFGSKNNDPVDFLIAISAPDAETLNEKVIVQIMEIFDDDEIMTILKNATTESEVELAMKKLDKILGQA